MRAGRDFWPWTDASDEATCSRALEALHQVGALGADDRGWLEPALQRGIGAPLGIATPWAAWAARISERTRPPIAAGALAITVTTLNARSSAAACAEANAALAWIPPRAAEHEVPDEVTRWSLAARVLRDATGGHAPLADRIASWLLGLGEYPAASAPRNPPLGFAASRPGGGSLSSEQPPRVRASCGVREAVALWTLPALLADQDLVEWSRFGQAVAEPIALLGDLVRLWLDPDAHDLRDAALTPLVEAWLAEPSLGAALLRAYAGERASAVRRLEIHSLLASEPYRAHLERVARRALASAKNHLPDMGVTDLRVAATEFLDALGHSLRVFDSLMAFRSLLNLRSAPGIPTGLPPTADHTLRDAAETDMRLAVAFLSQSAPWPGSWEVHRFGVFGSQDKPVGQWFIRGMILRALLEIGHDVHGEAVQLLGEIPPGELRHFYPWRGIPPEADCLGLMLEFVAATGAERDRAETWIPLLLANTDEHGIAPTYFYRDLAGRPTTPSGEAWPGDDCNAMRLNLLCGLLTFDAARFDELIQANTARVLADSGAGAVAGVYYYDAPYTALTFLRFARLYRDKAIDHSLWGDIAVAAAALRARMAACQRLDGGWGSPQRTAFCLAGCAMDLGADLGAAWNGDAGALLLERGMRYLGEHQLADGSWPAEPLYRIPLKRGREGYHQGRALTTAFCAHALRAALTALAHRDRADDQRAQ